MGEEFNSGCTVSDTDNRITPKRVCEINLNIHIADDAQTCRYVYVAVYRCQVMRWAYRLTRMSGQMLLDQTR
jgi:hypothetical protein